MGLLLGAACGRAAYAQDASGSAHTLVLNTSAQQAVDSPAGQATATPNGIMLTLKRVIELALQNSTDLQLAKIQSQLAQHSALITKAEFMPNLYAGSGAGYTYGIPETPGGRAPSIFDVTYTQQILNEPLRGQAKELQEQAQSQKIVLQDVRNSVIVRTAMAYLELGKVRHSLDLLRAEQESADKILQVTSGRESEGFELPVEVTKAQLTKAQVVQRILQLEGRQDELEVFLRAQIGFAADQPIEVSPEELPGQAEQEGANLVAMAMQNNTGLQLAESDVRAKEFRLKGEKRGYFPTLELVSVYSVLGKFNNYDQFFRTFQRNNFNAGVQVQLPHFQRADQGQRGTRASESGVREGHAEQQKNRSERGRAAENAAACEKKTRPKKWRGWSCNWRSRISRCFNLNTRKAN